MNIRPKSTIDNPILSILKPVSILFYTRNHPASINNQIRKSEMLTSPTEDDVERLNYS